MAHELGCNELRGRGVARDIRQRRLALRTAPVFVTFSKQLLGSWLMRIGVEHEGAGGAELSLPAGKGPARDDPRERGHVRLAIAAVDPERMQLHDFACEIFVQTALPVSTGARVRTNRLL